MYFIVQQMQNVCYYCLTISTKDCSRTITAILRAWRFNLQIVTLTLPPWSLLLFRYLMIFLITFLIIFLTIIHLKLCFIIVYQQGLLRRSLRLSPKEARGSCKTRIFNDILTLKVVRYVILYHWQLVFSNDFLCQI